MFIGTDNCLSRKNSHYSSLYIKNFTFSQNFAKTYNPLTFISTLQQSETVCPTNATVVQYYLGSVS